MSSTLSAQTIKSKKGHQIVIMPYEESYFKSVVKMYDTYQPLGSVQGLPPLDENKRHQWIQDIISNGINFLAVHKNTVVGHTSLFSMPANWVEYFIFIHQEFQRQGIGTAMSFYVINWARQKSISTIWLTVERRNFIAISLYRKVGFKRIGSTGDSWDMILTLNQ